MTTGPRELPESGGAAAAGRSSTPGQSAEPLRSGRRFGYAVVGLGALTRSDILPAFAAARHARLAALVTGDPGAAMAIAREHGLPPGAVYSYAEFDRIADNPDIDAVYLVLPNHLHAEFAIRAFQAGRDVLVEKPMAVSVAECEAMIAAGQRSGRLLSVAYRLRYEPNTREMIRLARERVFGAPRVIEAVAGFPIGRPDQWRLRRAEAGGGSMMDIGIYAVNAARYLAGENPVEVSAMESTDRSDARFREVEDTVAFQLRFPGGVLASCVSSYGVWLNRFRVIAERGAFEMEPAWSRSGVRLRVAEEGAPVVRELPEVNHFAAMMDDLALCHWEGRSPVTDGAEGLNDLRVIEAVYKSLATGRPVRIPEDRASPG